jgi:putative SOS response-associated peptidase YedK
MVEARWQPRPCYHRKPLDQFKLSTNNARWEDKGAQVRRSKRTERRGVAVQRANWESGTHVPWKFAAVDRRPVGLAALWIRWHGPADEVGETYTMILEAPSVTR